MPEAAPTPFEQMKLNLERFEPGLYRGGSDPIFGIWRLTNSGIWLFSVPVEGNAWRRAGDQTGNKLTPLL